MIHDLVPLELLDPGQSAEVCQLVGTPRQVHRLEELGLRTGMVVQVLQRGRPCIVRTSGGKLCFRDSAALQVLVRRMRSE